MKIGDQLVAPEGFESLVKGERYSFLKNDKSSMLISLIKFSEGRVGAKKAGRRISLIRLPRGRFENALMQEKIIKADIQYSLPPWLRQVEGADLDSLDLVRQYRKKTNRSRVEERYSYIHDLVMQTEAILAAENPYTLINLHAKQCVPAQNKTRIAEWFFSYVCFGRKLSALYPEFPNIGLWSRGDKKHENANLGRTSLSKGRHYGFASAPQEKQINDSYLKRAGLGRTLKKIYREALVEDWGCLVRLCANGKVGELELYHPEGKPFPNTYGKFRYRVIKNFGLAQMQNTLYGKARFRSKIAPSNGKYTEEVANIMEQIEVDAFYLKERASSSFSTDPMPRLCVVRGVCVSSKCIVGIGFSLGGEKAEAYRAMLFSAAIAKDKFCQLFGLTVTKEEWPCEGLSPHLISDRGAAPYSAIIAGGVDVFPVKEMTPGYSGQSKASVESSHPRDVHLEEAPSYVVSALNIVELAQREIFRAVMDNHTSSVEEQIIGQRVADDVLPTPHALWNYLDNLGRNDACSVSFSDAVRRFLMPINLTVKHNGVWLGERTYTSNEFISTNTLDKVASGQTIELKGYSLFMCVRFVWIEIDHQIIELEAKLPYRDDKGQLFITMEELKMEAQKKAILNSAQRTHSDAANIKYIKKFSDTTGKKWSDETRRAGTAKSTAKSSKEESIALSPPTSRRKSK